MNKELHQKTYEQVIGEVVELAINAGLGGKRYPTFSS